MYTVSLVTFPMQELTPHAQLSSQSRHEYKVQPALYTSDRNDKECISPLLPWEINVHAYLLSQQLGSGFTTMQRIAAYLGLRWRLCSPNTWTKLSEWIGRKQQALAKEVQRENIVLEKAGTINKPVGDTMDNGEMIGITGSYDAGWQRRTVGLSYQSRSAHGFLIGGET